MNEFRFALRALRKHPAFTVVAVLTLALGIGANTAIFSVVNGVLLRPLPYQEPHRIMALWELTEQGNAIHVSRPNFRDWQEQSRGFAAMAVHSSPDFAGRTTVLGGREATRAQVTAVSSDFFGVFGAQPALGRAFAAEDFRWGAYLAIVSHRFWRDQLGGNPDLASLTVDVFGRRLQVIGVMPPAFRYPGETDIWGPLPPTDESRRAHNWRVVGRLAEGVQLAAARADLTGLAARLKEAYGSDTDAAGVRVTPLQDELVGAMRRPLWLLLGAAAFVLLVACTNLASTVLARGAARQREFAVRESLGATRRRLILQLLTESAILTLVGAAAALVLSRWLLDGLSAAAPRIPRLDTVRIDGRVLGFAAGVASLATVLFGLLPALRNTRLTRGESVAGGTRGAAGRRSGPWSLLVAGEVSLALVLLIGSGLLIKSFWQVLNQHPGFDTADVLAVELAPPESKYEDNTEARGAYFLRVAEELSSLPGVAAVGLVNHVPLGGQSLNGEFEIEGRGPSSGVADYRIAGGDYFTALAIEVLRGRAFEARDAGAAEHVAVVDRTLAERYWPGEDPVGKRIRNLANDSWIYPDRWLTIVGVVEAVRHDAPTAPPRPTVYVHAGQRSGRLSSASVVLRGSLPPDRLVGPVRARLRTIDPDVPAEFATMERVVHGAVSDRRFTMLVLGGFAALALLLAAIGIYGVVSYAVERRAREMGIRLALGAAPGGVLRMVLGDSMRVVAVGALLGGAGAVALTGLIRGLLYGTDALDPLVLAAAVAVLVTVAGLATYLPARRAARVDPMVALRHE